MTLPTLAPAGLLPRDPVATVQDLQLAEALGYERLTDIRKLIKRNLAILETMGNIAPRGAMIDTAKGARRAVSEFHLNRAQAAFVAARSSTKRGALAAAYMAEVEALFNQGHLVVADNAEAREALEAAAERDRERRLLLAAEEREARSDALKLLKKGSSSASLTTKNGKPNWFAIHRENERKERRRLARLASSGRAASNKNFNGDPAS